MNFFVPNLHILRAYMNFQLIGRMYDNNVSVARRIDFFSFFIDTPSIDSLFLFGCLTLSLRPREYREISFRIETIKTVREVKRKERIRQTSLIKFSGFLFFLLRFESPLECVARMQIYIARGEDTQEAAINIFLWKFTAARQPIPRHFSILNERMQVLVTVLMQLKCLRWIINICMNK